MKSWGNLHTLLYNACLTVIVRNPQKIDNWTVTHELRDSTFSWSLLHAPSGTSSHVLSWGTSYANSLWIARARFISCPLSQLLQKVKFRGEHESILTEQHLTRQSSDYKVVVLQASNADTGPHPRNRKNHLSVWIDLALQVSCSRPFGDLPRDDLPYSSGSVR